jgi:hypothetical protein
MATFQSDCRLNSYRPGRLAGHDSCSSAKRHTMILSERLRAIREQKKTVPGRDRETHRLEALLYLPHRKWPHHSFSGRPPWKFRCISSSSTAKSHPRRWLSPRGESPATTPGASKANLRASSTACAFFSAVSPSLTASCCSTSPLSLSSEASPEMAKDIL